VLSDRFTDATFAYQGGGRGLSLAAITQLEQLVQGDLRPDLTLILDIDVQLGLERARQRGELDRFESETISFFERVRCAYQARANAHPSRYALIDASQSLDDVQSDIEVVLAAALTARG
jgi:dTMP kinase